MKYEPFYGKADFPEICYALQLLGKQTSWNVSFTQDSLLNQFFFFASCDYVTVRHRSQENIQ